MPAPKVLLFTGTRADWSKMQVPARSFLTVPGLDFLDVWISGMHMKAEYGNTSKEVEGSVDGVRRYHKISNHDLGPEQVSVACETMKVFKSLVEKYGYTDVVIHGDRVEAGAITFAARLLNVRVHHIEGGEITGSVDNDIRYASTQYSTYHYVCSPQAMQNVLATGQPPDTVFNIGSPEMDRHAGAGTLTLQEVMKKYKIPFKEYGIVSFHSVTTETDHMLHHAATIFATLQKFGKPFIIIKPNNDPGTEAIRNVIDVVVADQDGSLFYVAPSIVFDDFSTLQKNAKIFIGNSSAGVREMPFHGVASINVGSRQSGRASNIKSIINASADDHAIMLEALNEGWNKKFKRDTTFGDGKSEEKLTAILQRPDHFNRAVQKSLTFGN